MNNITKLTQRKTEIIKEIAALEPMRKGSLSEQFLETVRADGRKTKRGPYMVYTFKEKGKTVSRRVKDKKRAALYRRQIATFRRFQELSKELLQVSQRIADLSAWGLSDEKKKFSQ